MDRLLRLSYQTFTRDFPSRGDITSIPTRALAAAFFSFMIIGLAPFVLDPAGDPLTGIAIGVAGYLLTTIFGTSVMQWFLNRYVEKKFSWSDTLALQFVFTGFVTCLFAFLDTTCLFAGESASFAFDIVSVVVVIYFLLTYQKGLVRVLGITLSEAAMVIFSPLLVFILAWLAFVAALMVAAPFFGG